MHACTLKIEAKRIKAKTTVANEQKKQKITINKYIHKCKRSYRNNNTK